jgi:hypothetical protein
MRYRFLDDIVSVELEPEPRIEITKTFAPGDDALSGPAGPERVPNSLILELLAMAGGHLVFRHGGERRLPLLLKAREVRFTGPARPGVALRAVVRLQGSPRDVGDATLAEAEGSVFSGTEEIASGRLLYVCVSLPGVDIMAAAASR